MEIVNLEKNGHPTRYVRSAKVKKSKKSKKPEVSLVNEGRAFLYIKR